MELKSIVRLASLSKIVFVEGGTSGVESAAYIR